MKSNIILVYVITFLFGNSFNLQAQIKGDVFTYKNPISNGIAAEGIRDCQIFRDGDSWYMTATAFPHWERQEQDKNLNQGVPLYKSDDLLNWHFIKYIVNRPDSTKWYYRRFWAPEVQKIKGKYYATFNCSNPSIGYDGQNTGFAVADHVEGPYRVVTEQKPLINGNDLTLFEDTDGKVWAFWNQGREFGIGFAQVDLDKGVLLTEPCSAIKPSKVDFAYDNKGNMLKTPGYNGKPVPKVAKYYDWDAIGIEGAYVIKKEDKYYLFYSSWTRGYEIGYATAEKITGPWVKSENNPFYGAQSQSACKKNGFVWNGNPQNPFNQVGHNEVFVGPDGNLWLSCHGITNSNPERPLLVIDPLEFQNGEIVKKEPSFSEQKIRLQKKD